jgi:hypothetical protein
MVLIYVRGSVDTRATLPPEGLSQLKHQTLPSPTQTTLATKKRQAITGEKQKSLHCPQLDHQDADGLAGHKTWRTAQTTTRIF